VSPTELRERIQEKARARQLIGWMAKMDMELRTGAATTAEIRKKMARWAEGAKRDQPKEQRTGT
jgi:hypothetical protein